MSWRYTSVVGLCFRLCLLLLYLGTFTKLMETRDQRTFCFPVICCRRKWPHHGLTQRWTPHCSDTAATGSNEYYIVGYLSKRINNQRSWEWEILSDQDGCTWQDHSKQSFLQARKKFIQSFSLQDVSLGPVSFAAIFVVHSPSSHPRLSWMWLPPILRHSMGLSISSPKEQQ